jgi:hypothetical protein
LSGAGARCTSGRTAWLDDRPRGLSPAGTVTSKEARRQG